MADRKRVLMIGQEPDLVDLSDPAVPEGLTAEKIRSGFEGDRDRLIELGYDAEILYVGVGVEAANAVVKSLQRDSFDCVTIGGGLRLPLKQTELFEAVMNAVHEGAPGAKLAFTTAPDETAKAVARQIGGAK